MSRLAWVIGILAACLALTINAQATMIMPFSVEEMAQQADKIFVGTCLEVRRSLHAHRIPMLTVSFAVTEVLKGDIAKTLTFQQIAPISQGLVELTPKLRENRPVPILGPAVSLPGLPNYSSGQEMLVFLARPGKLGLTAPVGLFQGKMVVRATVAGKKFITNRALKKTQIAPIPLPAPGERASYEQFVEAIRILAQPAP